MKENKNLFSLNGKSNVRFTLKNQFGEEIQFTITMEQLEGSTPCFNEQIKEFLPTEGEQTWNIVKRDIVE